jgi:hypothetical protein
MMRQICGLFPLGALAAGLVLVAPAEARADQVGYVGMHPAHAGGFCYIEAPHVHVYTPNPKAKVMYRMHGDAYHFVGDPVAFQYDGPTVTYVGHHPVHVDPVVVGAPAGHVEFCYLDGPHYHHDWPPPDARFELKGDAYWYVGGFPPAYGKHKKRYATINALYQPIAYTRPVVTVEPPVGYVGVVVPSAHVGVGVGAGVAAGVGVSAGVEVYLPAPVLEVEVGLPGVVVVDGHHHHHGKYKKKRGKYKKHKRRNGARRVQF